MRLSSLLVAVILFLSPVLFAQHFSGGGSSSGGSASSSSSHSGSSSGSSSASHTSSSHSSGGHSSSSSHSSGGSVSHNSSKGSGASHSSTQPSRSREPKQKGDLGRDTAERAKKARPEHKGVFAFLHHRHRKPEPKVVALPIEDEHRHRVCAPGQSPGRNGVCVVNPANASNQCAPNAPGVSCTGIADQCASFRGALDGPAAELRSINAEMQNAGCSGTAPGQECGFLSQRREAAVAHYRAMQSGIPANCRALLPDPLSL
jgi:hypothetical protein